jgi:hypothetical protein
LVALLISFLFCSRWPMFILCSFLLFTFLSLPFRSYVYVQNKKKFALTLSSRMKSRLF